MPKLINNETVIMPLYFKAFIGIWMVLVIIVAFFYLPPAKGFADPESARIIVFHLPCALISVLGFLLSTLYAIIYLKKREQIYDIKSSSSAELGYLFTFITVVTGMIFAQRQWGDAWNWDPRQTSILMLMILYASYFVLRGAINSDITKAKISAAYNIAACAVMPHFVFIMPRMVASLHPTTTLFQSDSLSFEYRAVLIASALGLTAIFVWILRLRIISSIIEFEKRRQY
ncbi:MAG: cytochrome c biogenesis protein CcsA [Armatimonadota bacterium]